MFNQQKNINEFEQNLLISKLAICAEESSFPATELPYIKSCIKTFVASLTDYDYGYVSRLKHNELEDLLVLIKEPRVLLFLISRQLSLHWIFGSYLTTYGESDEIRNRLQQYNAPWGKDIILKLTRQLTDISVAYFVNKGIINFNDLRSWDKGNEKGIDFVYDVLHFLSTNALKVQQLLEEKTFNKTTLQYHFLEHGTEGLLN